MKTKLLLYFLVLSLVYGCKDAVLQPNDYPFLITKPVTEIDATGATFEATIVVSGKDNVIDYGFIVSDGKTEVKLSISNKSDLKDFKIRIKSDLILNQTYTCKAYITNGISLVYGNKVQFKSLGSNPPVITDFSPKEGFDGDKVKIIGKYFSTVNVNNKVFVNNVPATIISSNDSVILFTMPLQSFTGQASIAVETNSVRATSLYKFNILGPQITAVSSLSDFSGKLVTLTGTNFIKNSGNITVSFGSYNAEIVTMSDTKIDVLVPIPTNSLLNNNHVFIKLVIGQKTVTYATLFVIKSSWQSKSAPLTFNWPTNYEAGFTYQNKGYMHDRNHGFLYEYNPVTDKWSQYGSTAFTGEIYSGSLYIPSNDKFFRVGGINYLYVPVNDLWSYSFTDNTWTKRSNLPFSFSKASYFNLDNQLYVLTYEGQLWQCNFESGQYTRLKDFPAKFNDYFLSTFMANGNAFAVQYGKTWMYDKGNDTWIEKRSNIFYKQQYSESAKCFTSNNTGYVLNSGSDLYKYDYVNDKWIFVSKYPGSYASISEKSIFVVGSTTYIAAIYSYYVGGSPFLFSYQD